MNPRTMPGSLVGTAGTGTTKQYNSSKTDKLPDHRLEFNAFLTVGGRGFHYEAETPVKNRERGWRKCLDVSDNYTDPLKPGNVCLEPMEKNQDIIKTMEESYFD